MADLPDPVVRFGVALAVAILWVAKGYVLSVYRGDREFRVVYAAKTLLLGVVAGALVGVAAAGFEWAIRTLGVVV